VVAHGPKLDDADDTLSGYRAASMVKTVTAVLAAGRSSLPDRLKRGCQRVRMTTLSVIVPEVIRVRSQAQASRAARFSLS
jgi:hypothetical protein